MVIYLIENLANGKRCVGQTTFDLATRRDNVCTANGGGQAVLHKAIRKYGVESFAIKEIARAVSLEELDFLEIRFINWLGTLAEYNQAEGGRNNRKGVKASEETRAKQRTAWVARRLKSCKKTGPKLGSIPWNLGKTYKFKKTYPLESWTQERRAAQSARAKIQGLKSNNLLKGDVT